MPKFRIYVPVMADDVYEVEAENKEEARKMYEEGLDYEHFIHTTQEFILRRTQDMDTSTVFNAEIDIEECS